MYNIFGLIFTNFGITLTPAKPKFLSIYPNMDKNYAQKYFKI
jgi:hypothetical protein